MDESQELEKARKRADLRLIIASLLGLLLISAGIYFGLTR
jgi:hypothetical protein